MIGKFKNYILKEKLFSPEDKILLAVSGGMDSTAMCFLFKSAGYDFGIAHCNFKLRGAASDADELFVKELADHFEVEFHSIKFETEKIAADQKTSLQVTARKLRYHWFKKIAKQFGYQSVATAHHATDSIETVLYNFTKGCGIRGLHGILPKKGKIIRPLLFASRSDIEQFVETHKIAYREDVSNASDKYMRNKIRHQVIPILNEINPSFEKTAIGTVERLKETEAIFNWAIDQFRNEAIEIRDDLVYIDFALLPENGKATVLYEFIRPFGFNDDQCRQILFDAHEQSGTGFYSDTHRLIIDRRYYIINKIAPQKADHFFITPETDQIILEDNAIVFSVLNKAPLVISREKNIAEFDFDQLDFPLQLRKWKPGDIFQPLGMKGKKQKLQDFFTHQKLSIPEKEKIWILENKGQVCWVVGWRIDERFKITDQTQKCFRVEKKSR